MNPNTKYYTIAGDWNPKLGNCQLTLALPMEKSGSSTLPKPNDGDSTFIKRRITRLFY